eukprot:31520-Eustigmatos_ZCMA.PRE.1
MRREGREAGGRNDTGPTTASLGGTTRVAVDRVQNEESMVLNGHHEADTDGKSAEEGSSSAAKRHKHNEVQDA